MHFEVVSEEYCMPKKWFFQNTFKEHAKIFFFICMGFIFGCACVQQCKKWPKACIYNLHGREAQTRYLSKKIDSIFCCWHFCDYVERKMALLLFFTSSSGICALGFMKFFASVLHLCFGPLNCLLELRRKPRYRIMNRFTLFSSRLIGSVEK